MKPHVEAVIACFEQWETMYPESGEQLEQAIASRFRVLAGSRLCPDDRELFRMIREYFAADQHKCIVNPKCPKVCSVKLQRRPPIEITCPEFVNALHA